MSDVMTTRAAARELGVGIRVVQKLIARGVLPARDCECGLCQLVERRDLNRPGVRQRPGPGPVPGSRREKLPKKSRE